MSDQLYPTDLTDSQWERLKDFIPPPQSGGRRRLLDMRLMVNALFSVVVGGITWRMLPRAYPKGKKSTMPFASGLTTASGNASMRRGGLRDGSAPAGTRLPQRGVWPARVCKPLLAKASVEPLKGNRARGGHALRVVLQPVWRPEGVKGLTLWPRRWGVERTFAWLNQYRRLSKDYEVLPSSREAMIYMAMIRLMVRRLAAA